MRKKNIVLISHKIWDIKTIICQLMPLANMTSWWVPCLFIQKPFPSPAIWNRSANVGELDWEVLSGIFGEVSVRAARTSAQTLTFQGYRGLGLCSGAVWPGRLLMKHRLLRQQKKNRTKRPKRERRRGGKSFSRRKANLEPACLHHEIKVTFGGWCWKLITAKHQQRIHFYYVCWQFSEVNLWEFNPSVYYELHTSHLLCSDC